MAQVTMSSFDVEKVRVDGMNLAVVVHFGKDAELHENWLHVVVGWNESARRMARRWIGSHVYTMSYYRRSARRLNEIAAFVRSTPNKSVNSHRRSRRY